jgi:hypothetical protein
MYETSNPDHMINHENSFGLRPLYIACLHGHLNVSRIVIKFLKVVKTLLHYGADPTMLSVTNIDTKE